MVACAHCVYRLDKNSCAMALRIKTRMWTFIIAVFTWMSADWAVDILLFSICSVSSWRGRGHTPKIYIRTIRIIYSKRSHLITNRFRPSWVFEDSVVFVATAWRFTWISTAKSTNSIFLLAFCSGQSRRWVQVCLSCLNGGFWSVFDCSKH